MLILKHLSPNYLKKPSRTFSRSTKINPKNKLARLVHLFRGVHKEHLPEKRKQVADLFLEASDYYFEHKIYFDSSTWEKIENVFNLMKDSLIAFDLSQDGEEYSTKDLEMCLKNFIMLIKE